MNVALVEKLLGGDRVWAGPCLIILDADAEVKSAGPDSVGGGGVKTYAPRYASGQIEADTCCLLRDLNAVVVVDETKHRDQTGAEIVKQKLIVVDVGHVVGFEYRNLHALKSLDLPVPKIVDDGGYRPGMLVG